MTTTHESRRQQIIEQLKADLHSTQEEKGTLVEGVAEAKARLAECRQRISELNSALRVFKVNSKARLTKDSVHPLLTTVLKNHGPMDDENVKQQLTHAIRQRDLPLTGFTLVLGAFAKQYRDTEGLWRIPPAEADQASLAVDD